MNASKVQSRAVRKFCAMLNEAGRRSNYLPFLNEYKKRYNYGNAADLRNSGQKVSKLEIVWKIGKNMSIDCCTFAINDHNLFFWGLRSAHQMGFFCLFTYGVFANQERLKRAPVHIMLVYL